MAEVSDHREATIINAIRSGDYQTLDHLYKTHWPMALKFVLLNNGTKEDAAELYQESIIAFYEQLKKEKFALTCSIKTYLYSICRNKWLNELRSRKKVLDIEEYVEASNGIAMDPLLPQSEDIVNAVITLGDPCQTILIGYYYEKLSLELIAQRLQYQNANVAKQQKFRCIEKLKKMFLKEAI